MANTESIRRFLTGTVNQRGVIVFMSNNERDAWLTIIHDVLQGHDVSYSRTAHQYFGALGSTLLVFVYTGEHEARQRLRGHLFDRFWHEGYMPRHVGDLVLERCR